MKRLNKKAAIILLTSSLAFIVATVMLLDSIKLTSVIGTNQMSLIDLPKEESVYMAYLEVGAKFALAETMRVMPSSYEDMYTACNMGKESCKEVPVYFKAAFKKHVNSFNKAYEKNLKQILNIDDYEFKSRILTIDNKRVIELVGVSKEKAWINKNENLSYGFYPSFKILADLETLNEMSKTTENMVMTSFNQIVDKFQRCLNVNKDKAKCYCDGSDIDLSEIPEGYKISIVTTSEKDKLFGGAEYQFKLLDKNNQIVVYGRRQQVRTLRGIFGSYGITNEDLQSNRCFPGALSISRGEVISKETGKGKLYSFEGGANCKGYADFRMVEFVKEADYSNVSGPLCSDIGVKSG